MFRVSDDKNYTSIHTFPKNKGGLLYTVDSVFRGKLVYMYNTQLPVELLGDLSLFRFYRALYLAFSQGLW